jgi:hypothetical protein
MADPTSVTQYQYGFAPEVRPYAEGLLGQAQAYTDVGQNPYQSYTGQRVAQFSPLQQQSYDYAGQMQSAPQLQDATALAGQAGLGGLNAQYTFQPSNFTAQNAQEMMNPFLDTMNAATRRNAAISQQGQQAQAANAGAFGGGRDAIMRNQGNAELQRNLAQNQYNAFNQAQQQYNTQYGQNAAQQQFGAGLGMQGLGIANQAAQNLGALGQTQYGQNMGITGLQNQFGLQQQQQAQNLLNTQYEDYTNAQNYPYKQMGFMSDILRGLPTAQTGASMYQAPPTTIQNLASLGLGAAGISKLMANGGAVRSYANGGITQLAGGGSSVFSPEFKRYAVGHIDPRQLPIAQQNAQARGDLETNQFAMQEMADDAAVRRGIAPALPPGTDVVRAAGGGILAFQDRGLVEGEDNSPTITDEEIDALLAREANGEEGSGISTAVASNPKVGEIANMLLNRKARTFSPSAQESLYRYNLQRGQRDLGPNTGAEEYNKYLTGLDSAQAGNMSRGHGMTMLRAAAALQKSGVTPGDRWGKMFENIADSEEKLQASDTAQKDYLAKAKFALADSKRKERAGLSSDSRAATSAYVKYMQEADKEGRLNAKAAGDLLVNQDRARALAARAAAGGGDKTKLNEMLAKAEIAHETNPTDVSLKTVTALRRAVDRTKITDVGPVKAEQTAAAQTDKAIANEADAWSKNYKGRQAQKAYAIANGIKTGTANPSWREEAREHHRKNFGKAAPVGGNTVINFDANGKPI